jgi:small subunit ribosomal protein S20
MSVAADAMRRRSLDIGSHYAAIITARMANTQSAKKRVRASLRKRDRNRSTRSAVKTLVSRARRPAVPDAASLTSEEVRRAISALDKAAEKGVLHANNASRRKARLMSALVKLAPAAEQPGSQGSGKAAPSASAAKKPAAKPAKARA